MINRPLPLLALIQAKQAEPTARQRALDFAKNVPKPETKKPPPQGPPQRGGKGSAAAEQPKSELELLEEQHRLDQQRIEAIRQELGKLGA